jgi:hypothetical protein
VFEGEVGDDFVGVHVEAGAGAALEHVDGELVHAPAVVEDLVACPHDGVAFFRGQGVESSVGECRGFFHLYHAADEVGYVVDGFPGDVEVIHGPEGVNAVVVLVGYFHFPQ